MVNSRTFVRSTTQSVDLYLTSRLYSSNVTKKPRQVKVHTRKPNKVSHLRYPIVEGFLAARGRIQPFIHNVRVTITEAQNVYHYMIFFKRHVTFTPNKCIRKLLHGVDPVICSDVIVMRVGKSSYVNMRERDCGLADFAVKRLSQEPGLRRIRIPSHFRYQKD